VAWGLSSQKFNWLYARTKYEQKWLSNLSLDKAWKQELSEILAIFVSTEFVDKFVDEALGCVASD
jgi:hypothetical protein